MAADGATGPVVVVVVVLVDGDVVVVVVLVEGDVVVVVVVVVVEDEDVVVVDLGGAVVLVVAVGGVSGGVDVRKFPADVPPELLDAPMSEDRGRPPSTSTSVTRPSARTKDAAMVTTNGQRGFLGGPRRVPAGVVDGVRATRLHATSRVSPTSSASGAPPPAPGAGRSPCAGCPPGGDWSPRAGWSPRAAWFPEVGWDSDPASTEASIADERARASTSPVAPRVRQRWTSGRRWPFFTTTSRTLECVRSIDSQTMAVTVVATMLPTATPITVPDTPKTDAISAERTAPLADAAIWIGFSRFMGSRRTAARACGVAARAYPCALGARIG